MQGKFRRRQRVVAAVLAVVVAVPGLPATGTDVAHAALPGDASPWNVPTDTWMSDMRDTIGTKTLATIPIPGTHQSATYNLGSTPGFIAPDVPFDPTEDIIETFDDCSIAQAICDVFEDVAVSTADAVIADASFRWGSNQQRNLRQQLDGGIRFLDIRLCQGNDDLPRACHGVFSRETFQKDLDDVHAFNLAHPDEFVIMTIRATGDWTVSTSAISEALDDTFGDLLIPVDATVDPLNTPLETMWTKPGRILVIDNPGEAIPQAAGRNFVHGSSLVDGPYLNTRNASDLTDFAVDTLVNRTDTTKLQQIQTQMTAQTADIVAAEVGLIAHRLNSDGLLSFADPGTLAAEIFDSAYGLPNADGTPRALDAPYGTIDVPVPGETPERRGLWRESERAGVRPLFDRLDSDSSVRPNLNVVTVDHFHRLDGFVEAMLSYAGAGEPPLTVASVDVPVGTFGAKRPYLNYLPAGQRRVVGNYQRFDRGASDPWNDVPVSDFTPERVPEIDLAPIPGAPELNAMTWTELSTQPLWSDEEVQNPDGTANLAIIGGLEDGPMTVSLVQFPDAVGPATVELHQGRIYVAYPVLNGNLAEVDPRLRVESAAVPADWSTLTAADFDQERTFAEIEMPIRAQDIFAAELNRFVFPQADLISAGGVLSVAWKDAQTPDFVVELRLDPLGGPPAEYRFADPGVPRWAPLTFGDDPLDIVDLQTSPSFDSLEPLHATAVAGQIVIVHDRFGVLEIFSGDSTGSFGSPLTTTNPLPSIGSRSRIAIGEWEGQVLLVRNGWGAPIDPDTGEALAAQRKVTSSQGPIAISVPVRNQPPVADAGGPYVTNEGSPIALDASGSTDPDGDPLTYSWDLDDDGMFGDANVENPTFVDVVNEGIHQVSVQVSDGSETNVASTTVTVVNVAPTIDDVSIGSTGADEEGVVYRAELTISDPGILDPLSCDVDWGDGTVIESDALGGVCTVEHVYADDRAYSVSYSVSDGVDDVDGNAVVDVANADPRVIPPGNQTVAEGSVLSGVVASFNDPGTADTHTATIDWGDGTTAVVEVDQSPFGPPGSTDGADGILELPDHTYTDNRPSDAPYIAELCVDDDDDGDDCVTFEVIVANVAPDISLATVDASQASEGDTVTANVSWTDPGADSHTVLIDWGDGTPATTIEPPLGDRSATATHTWLDDDPTATPSDMYTVTVTVADDDEASDLETFIATVDNVAPTVELNDLPDSIYENDSVALRGEISDPSDDSGGGDSFTVNVAWGDGGTNEVQIAADEARAFNLDHQYLDDGDYEVAVSVTDDDGGVVAASTQTVTVKNLDPVVVAPDAATIVGTQYSDPFGGSIVFVATDVAGYAVDPETLSATATFDELPLPGEFSLGAPMCESATRPGLAPPSQVCTWTIVGSGAPLLLPPGEYPIEVTVTDDDGGTHTAAVDIVVLAEDARVDYTGPSFAATTSASDGTATIELRATVRDISIVTDDPHFDEYPGDISNANVTFVDRNGSTLCVAGVEFVFAGDEQIGTAACEWTASIGSVSAATFKIGMIVGGYYTRDDGVDDTMVTVAKPLDQFITGGGYLDYSDDTLSPAGVYAPSPDTKANFGFNVKFNKKGTKLQGNANLIIRSDGRVYQVKTNRLDSLGVWGDDPTMAEFEARANLTDVTDQDNPVSIGGNLRLQMRMTDYEAPADVDEIGWTLYDKDGVLLLSSNWEISDTEQHVATGNLVLHK